jgi:hypothetical protein
MRGQKMQNDFSEYIIFADESGDHSIASINPENPVFVLVFCIFRKIDYISVVKQVVAKLKIDFWGHDLVVLHNHAIRKSTGEFAFLFDEEVRSLFVHALNEMMKSLPFSIVATAIDKRYLISNLNSSNPYLMALRFCLEQTFDFLKEKQQHQRQTHIIVESRGKSEDRELGLTFDQISTQETLGRYPLSLRFANKQTNSSGLQIADLVAHPIARHIVNRDQPNKAFDIVKKKLLGFPEYEEIGLKCRPLESEKPRLMPRQDADRELPIHL